MAKRFKNDQMIIKHSKTFDGTPVDYQYDFDKHMRSLGFEQVLELPCTEDGKVQLPADELTKLAKKLSLYPELRTSQVVRFGPQGTPNKPVVLFYGKAKNIGLIIKEDQQKVQV